MVEGLLGQMCLPDRVLPEDESMPDEEGGVWLCFFLIKADLKSSVQTDVYDKQCSGSVAICSLNEGFALNIKLQKHL